MVLYYLSFLSAKGSLELTLGLFERAPARRRQIAPSAVHVKRQHGQGGAVRAGLSATASQRRALEREGDRLRACLREDTSFKVKRVALLGHPLRPSLLGRR